jgi:hypothetical protein
MASYDLLGSPIQSSPISIRTKCEILNHLWDLDLQPEQGNRNHEIYFYHYLDQCSLALHDGGRHLLARTHRDIVEIAINIKKLASKKEVAQILKTELSTSRAAKIAKGVASTQMIDINDDALVDGTINLVAGLLSMLSFESYQYGFDGREKVNWDKDTIKDCIHDHFGEEPDSLESVKLEPTFNALNLQRIAGIEIEWTANLADHLRLVDDDRKVNIFPFASFLECQEKK